MRSRLLSFGFALVVSSAVVIPHGVVEAATCSADDAVMVSNASSPTAVSFTGAELGAPAIHDLWDLTTGENNNKFEILGKVIGAAHHWFGNCTYPGLGIGNGSGWDIETRNITLWAWAAGVDADIARGAMYEYLGVGVGTATWGSSRAVLTDTPLVLDAGHILNKFSTRLFEWDFDGDGSYEVSTGSSPSASTSFITDGSIDVGVRVSSSGVVRTATTRVEVFVRPPVGDVGISINGGASRTSSRSVTVSVVWPAWATGLRVSNDGGFATGHTITLPLTPQFDWELDDAGEGVYGTNVYVRFIGSRIDSSQMYSDSIVLALSPTTTSTSTTTSTTAPPSEPVVSSSVVRSMSVSALSRTSSGQRLRTSVVVLTRSRSICAVRGRQIVSLRRGVCSVRITTRAVKGRATTRIASLFSDGSST